MYSVQVHVDMYLWELPQCVYISPCWCVSLWVLVQCVCISTSWYTNQHPASHFVFLGSSSCLNCQIVSVSRKKLHPLPPSEDLKEDVSSSPSSSSSAFNWRDYSLRSEHDKFHGQNSEEETKTNQCVLVLCSCTTTIYLYHMLSV